MRPGNFELREIGGPGKDIHAKTCFFFLDSVYKGIATRATANGYRGDLRADAVSRASALRQAQRPKKDTPEQKPRGARARKAAEKDDA